MWSRALFIDKVDRQFPSRSDAHRRFLDQIDKSDHLEAFFEGKGEHPTYHVCFKGDPKLSILRIYADGTIFVSWVRVRERFGRDVADYFVTLWGREFKDSGMHDSTGVGSELLSRLNTEIAPWVFGNAVKVAIYALSRSSASSSVTDE